MAANDESRESTGLRDAVRAKGIAFLVGGGGISGTVVAATAISTMHCIFGGIVVGFWLWHLCHLRIGYRTHLPQETIAFEACLILLTLGAYVCVFATPSAMAVSVIGSAAVIMMLLATGAVIAGARDHPDLVSGTVWLRSQSLVKSMDRWLQPHRRVLARPIFAVLRLMRPTKNASCFVVTLLLGVCAVTVSAVANVPAVHHALHLPGRPWHDGRQESKHHPEEKRSKSYDEVCRGVPPPWEAVLEPQRSALKALWLGGHDVAGHLVDGVGAGVGGCAREAFEPSSQPGIVVAVGYCLGAVRSVGVVMPDGTAVIMLGQVAVFAERKLREGTLLGASSRVAAGHGDLQTVRTTQGTYAFVRDHTSEGKLPAGTTRPACADSNDKDAKYTVVTPGAIEPWVTVARSGWVWPEFVLDGLAGRYDFRDVSGAIRARASCTSIFECRDEVGNHGTSEGSDAVAVELVGLAGTA